MARTKYIVYFCKTNRESSIDGEDKTSHEMKAIENTLKIKWKVRKA